MFNNNYNINEFTYNGKEKWYNNEFSGSECTYS